MNKYQLVCSTVLGFKLKINIDMIFNIDMILFTITKPLNLACNIMREETEKYTL